MSRAAQLYFRPTTTKMLGNLKVFVIALLMHALLKKRFTVIQVSTFAMWHVLWPGLAA